MLWIIVFLLAIAALFVAARRGQELFVVRLAAGRCDIVRGHLSAVLRGALEDISSSFPQEEISVSASSAGDELRLTIAGASEHADQRIRNAVGIIPLARLKAARR